MKIRSFVFLLISMVAGFYPVQAYTIEAPEPAPNLPIQEKAQQQEELRAHTQSTAKAVLSFSTQSAAISVQALPATSGMWISQGPGPTQNGQTENVSPNNEVVGAVHTVVAHPTDPDILWIGSANGGIWRTDNATAVNPTWTSLIDDLPSLSIGAMEMDPTDASNQTLLAGIGHFSSFSFRPGGPFIGLLRTTDGGTSWTNIGQPDLGGRNITGVGPRGNTIVVSASTRSNGTNPGVYRSTDGGTSFNLISGANGLPTGSAYDLVGDPSNTNRFYTGLTAGIFRSNDGGLSWSNIADATIAALIGGSTNNIEFAVHNNTGAGTNVVYAAIINNGQLAGLFRSADQGGNWIAMDVPQTNEGGPIVGLQPREKPGSQGSTHFSIVADPNDPNIVYVGGDRQARNAGPDMILSTSDDTWPNFIGATNFTGRLFRGDASVAPTGGVPSPQWEHLTHLNTVGAIPGGGTASNSSPHADSREMIFDANGDLIEGDDGGIYRRTSPVDNTGDWFSLNSNLQTTEFHNIAYDTVSNIIIGGAQDTGTHEQNTTGGTTYTDIRRADGGDVAVDDTSVAGQSTRYWSSQRLGGFSRRTCNATNTCGATTVIGLSLIGTSSVLARQFVTPVELNVTDQTRMIIGGSNSIYESFDQGDNIQELAGPGANRNAMVYGHQNDSELIVIGFASRVLVRTTANGALTDTPTSFPAGPVRDVAVDPNDETVFYAIDANQVFETTDAGTTWTDITGNLTADGTGLFRTVVYINQGNADRIVVGTNAGNFFSSVLDPDNWTELGTKLPNVPVWDLDYDTTDDVLLAGTLGRGAWTLSNASAENLAPVASCTNKTEPTDPGICSANASIDNGSFDPDNDPINLTQNPPGPYDLGMTGVTLHVTDTAGLMDSCMSTVTVVDLEPPVIQCNAPSTITPPDAPISFTVSAQDNCMVATVAVTGFDCFKHTKKGKRIDKTSSCQVSFAGDTVTIDDSGGVDDHITWDVTATDGSGNVTNKVCEIVVENPGGN